MLAWGSQQEPPRPKYRSFWKLIYQYPPSERKELAAKLRNRFRQGRLIKHPRHVASKLQEAEMLVEHHKSLLGTRASRETGRAGSHGARGCDVVFEQFKYKQNNTIPGLRMKESKKLTKVQLRTREGYNMSINGKFGHGRSI